MLEADGLLNVNTTVMLSSASTGPVVEGVFVKVNVGSTNSTLIVAVFVFVFWYVSVAV